MRQTTRNIYNLFIIVVLTATMWLGISTSTQSQVLLQKAQPTSGHQLGFTVMGTIAQGTPDNNVALVKVLRTGNVTAVKIGHVIDNTFKVTDISEKYVRVVTRDAKHFLVYLDRFSGEFKGGSSARPSAPAVTINPEGRYREEGFERDAGKVKMSASYRDRIVNKDLSTILMQATAEPYLQNGQIVGFKMSQIDSDSIFAKGGLRDEDIITAINGQRLTSVVGAVSLLKSLKEASQVEVELMRGGSQTTISIAVQ